MMYFNVSSLLLFCRVWDSQIIPSNFKEFIDYLADNDLSAGKDDSSARGCFQMLTPEDRKQGENVQGI